MPVTTFNAKLRVLGEHRVASPIRPEAFKYDNRTDLTAYISDTNETCVYRLGGQLVHRLEADDLSGAPTCLEWTRMGDALLIGTDSGIVDTLELGTGRLSKGALLSNDQDSVPVTGVGSHIARFDLHLGDNKKLQNGYPEDDTQLADWLSKFSISGRDSFEGGDSAGEVLSLPHMLAKMDVTDILPKLSPIPVPSRAGPGMPAPVLKNAQKDLHLVLNNKSMHSADTVEVTFTSLGDGSVAGRIGDIFDRNFQKTLDMEALFFCQRTSSSKALHAVISRHADTQGNATVSSALSIDLFQIPLVKSESVHTGTILSSAVQLQRLDMYIGQCIETAALDWNTLTALPGRFVSNINESLEEKAEGRLQNHFAQLLLTGSCCDTVTEWLKEDLAERGHKRWELAMTSFYQSLSHLLEVNVLPALERCSICASTLRGLATYYEGSKKFDVQPAYLTSIIEAVECLQVLTHEALRILGTEQTQFAAFSKWLRIRVDIAASEAGSTTNTELLESEALNTDVTQVLSYLTKPFVKSKLEPIIGRRLPNAAIDAILEKMEPRKDAREDTIKAIREQRETENLINDSLYLPLQVRGLHQAVESCLKQMKRWQSKTWLPPNNIRMVLDTPLETLDVQLQQQTKHMAIVAAGADSEHRHVLHLHTLPVSQDSKSLGLKAGVQLDRALEVPAEFTILDIKLLQDGGIMALMESSSDEQSIVQLPPHVIAGQEAAAVLSLTDAQQYAVHTFGSNDGFTARHILVSGGKRGTKVVVLDRQRTSWKVLRLADHGLVERPASQAPYAPFSMSTDDPMMVD